MSKLEQLISNFASNHDAYCRQTSDYNETETRVDFINPFFELLGWDMLNSRGLSRPLREVISEANVKVDELTKKPDYEFRFNGSRKFFVEAKKPSVNILNDPEPAMQLRRYGWSANLPVSVLTNFNQVSIYDCSIKPVDGDNPNVGLLKTYEYKDFINKFDEIFSLLSHDAVATGKFDINFKAMLGSIRGSQTFDTYFLNQIEGWRVKLAQDILANNKGFSGSQINYLVQLFLNRIVFLRICEDRNLEQYETLKNIESPEAVVKLLELFRKADLKYDSGLFDLLTDTLTPSVVLSNEALLGIVEDLYYPRSPYSFSVVSPTILGSIYDRFISKTIIIDNNEVSVSVKPEVKESNGVFTTPPIVVKRMSEEALQLYKGDLLEATILDPAAGSGVFLTETYSLLLQKHLEKYVSDKDQSKLRVDDAGDYYLSLSTKRGILISQIYGVDIDAQAVEVAKFSLYLKLLEDVPNAEILESVESGTRALPRLENNIQIGNSLIDSESYFKYHGVESVTAEELSSISPFDWGNKFKGIIESGGFDIIIANPPYTRIQNMMRYSANEAHFYQSSHSPYESAHGNNFDKYQLFIERGYSLLNSSGILCYIVPHKFMTSQAGQPIRTMISSNKALSKVVHFGSSQIFAGQATTYSCIIFLSQEPVEEFVFERPTDLSQWLGGVFSESIFDSSHINSTPWVFLSQEESNNFGLLETKNPDKLSSIAEIFVGLQTSSDKIYIRESLKNNGGLITFQDYDGKIWEIEEDITRPAILDLPSFCDYSRLDANRFIIFPYKKVENRIVELSEPELKSVYPYAYAYLYNHKEELSKRSMQGNGSWFRFGRAQSLNKFNSNKLIIKNPALRATVSMDYSNIMFTGGGNGPYYGVIPKANTSIHFLHALMNSDLFDKWVKARSSEFRGGYFSYSRQFMENFPVPDLLKNKTEVDNIIESWNLLTSLPASAETPSQQILLSTQKQQILGSINGKIDSLYGLGSGDEGY